MAITRALACRPEILLLDEPTAEVDVENQAVVEKIILGNRCQNSVTGTGIRRVDNLLFLW